MKKDKFMGKSLMVVALCLILFSIEANAKCNGNACGVVSLTKNPSANGYIVRNSSNRKVNVSVNWMFIGCVGYKNFSIGPMQSQSFGNNGYCGDWNANFG